MFDKKAYWERRKQGLRGQEPLPEPQLAKWTEEDHKAKKCGEKQIGKERTSGVTMHMTKKGLVAVTRKMNRRKVVDRHFTKRGFEYGIRIGGKIHGKLMSAKRKFAREHKGERIDSPEITRHKELYPLEINPRKTNHMRMLERKEQRNARTASSAA